MLWPFTAYLWGTLALPLVVTSGAAVLLFLRRPVYGLAIVLALAPLTNLQTGGSKYGHRRRLLATR